MHAEAPIQVLIDKLQKANEFVVVAAAASAKYLYRSSVCMELYKNKQVPPVRSSVWSLYRVSSMVLKTFWKRCILREESETSKMRPSLRTCRNRICKLEGTAQAI